MAEPESTAEIVIPVDDFNIVIGELLNIIDRTDQINDETRTRFAGSLTFVDRFISQGSVFFRHQPGELNSVKEELCGPTRGTSLSLIGCGGRIRLLFRQPRGSGKSLLIGNVFNPQVNTAKEKQEVETVSGRFKDLAIKAGSESTSLFVVTQEESGLRFTKK